MGLLEILRSNLPNVAIEYEVAEVKEKSEQELFKSMLYWIGRIL